MRGGVSIGCGMPLAEDTIIVGARCGRTGYATHTRFLLFTTPRWRTRNMLGPTFHHRPSTGANPPRPRISGVSGYRRGMGLFCTRRTRLGSSTRDRRRRPRPTLPFPRQNVLLTVPRRYTSLELRRSPLPTPPLIGYWVSAGQNAAGCCCAEADGAGSQCCCSSSIQENGLLSLINV